jgi:regulator of sigma E protease
MHDFLVSAAAFIVLIGIMVLIHEMGHFVVAKLCKVRVEAFSIGFGPRLFGFKHGETDYKVCLLPLGGFVKMAGENFSELSDAAAGTATVAPVSDPGALTSHPRWQQMLIGVAGPAANFLLAFVAMLFYFGVINEVPAHEMKTSVIEWVTPGSPAAQAGFQTGDVIRSFDRTKDADWESIYLRLKVNAGQTVPVTVERGGQTVQLSFQVPVAAKAESFAFSDTGIQPQFFTGPIGVDDVQEGKPAYLAGLRAGDAIQRVDGLAFHSVDALIVYMDAGQGKPITLTVLRNGVTLPPIVATPAKLDVGYKLGFVPVPEPYRNEPLSLSAAASKSARFCADKSMAIFEVLNQLFTHKASVSQLAGPVGIARMAGEAAEMKGWLPKFGLGAFISINLGIVNLLPFPILDGGMILLLLIESTIRRDISMMVKERIYQAAFVVLISFFAFLIFNDVSKLAIFTHLKP